MRKKPDILLLLSVLVVSGVIISHFVVIEKSDKTTANLSLHNTHDSTLQTKAMTKIRPNEVRLTKLNAQELVRIDSSKQQIR
ncbi:MAG: hypothetical protein OQL19_16770 [Gammaproteobacteria bacterium]|nr:hypothetical protein [Gammaproteobacteria bacterium]